MASKRNSSKSKRNQQNRAKREALQARSARAGEATAVGAGARPPVSRPGQASAAAKGSAKAGGGGKKGGFWSQRQSPYTIPGQRAVTLAFMFAVVSAATLLISPLQNREDVALDDPRLVEEGIDVSELDDGDIKTSEVTVDRDDERVTEQQRAEDPDASEFTITVETTELKTEERILDSESPGLALAVLAIPSLLTGAALYFTKRPQRATAWNVCLMLFAGYIVLFGAFAIISLPSLIALGVGTFQTRKALAHEKAAGRAGAAGVIDVDATEVETGEEIDDAPAETDAADDASLAATADDTDAARADELADGAIDIVESDPDGSATADTDDEDPSERT